jgi:hypothetical protein
LSYFMIIGNILRSFGNVVILWYIFHRFGIHTYCVKKNQAIVGSLPSTKYKKSSQNESKSQTHTFGRKELTTGPVMYVHT